MSNLLKKKIKLQIPLSTITYHNNGIAFPWNFIQIMIPYSRIPLNFSLPSSLLEEFKPSLQGNLTIYLECHRIDFNIEILDVKVEHHMEQMFKETIAHINGIIDKIKSISEDPLSVEKVRYIFQEKGFNYTNLKVKRILNEIIKSKKKQQFLKKIPLKEITYIPKGISFQWDFIQITIPYSRVPIKFSLTVNLLEEFKTSFQGSITICIISQWLDSRIEMKEVKVENHVIQKFKETASFIQNIIDKVTARVVEKTLTFKKTRSILKENGFQFDKSKIHRILSEIVNSMPFQKIVQKISIPLSSLDYHSNEIRFFHNNIQLDVKKNKFPFEVGPILEKEKIHFKGDIVFHIGIISNYQWNVDLEQLLVEQGSQEIKKVEIHQETLKTFKQYRCQRICPAIKKLIDESSISLENAESILIDWGLGLKHKEIAAHIVSTISSWTEEKKCDVFLKEITYNDNHIIVPINGRKIRILASSLPFKTNHVLEKIKDVFEGQIRIDLYQSFKFIWNQKLQKLEIEKIIPLKFKIKINEEILKKFEKIHWLYIGLLEKVGPILAEKIIRERLISLDKIPKEVIESKGYDRKCIRILEEMADDIYLMEAESDLWFRIKDRLVWERPIFGAATYIFNWPQEELNLFIARIWISELQDIRKNRKESGYIDRVIHTPDDISVWEWNLKQKLKKKVF